MPFIKQMEDAILHRLDSAGDEHTAGVAQRRQMLGVAEQVFNLNRYIIGKLGKLRMQGLHQGDSMPNAVEKIWIAKGDVLGPSRDLLSDIRQDHITLHNPETPLIDWYNGAMAAQVLTATARLGVARDALLLWPHDEARISERQGYILAVWHHKALALQ